ncbi:PPOX class F420-dependent oxidoreductase [Nocardioides sp. TRM66260-LWL]|uniref:pyridoxamine 5'-phosphate oxidase family protein n=1 Tax=Nocardioides sp. TRM66260-LWL TaxID=2874478 RepID=UPI001CC55D39|nr:PPOX class F420-dependent oxidoreductase [Nocardioides sp. TRM66260-LWL]MBZ5734651.1 PPOX class F420-dependent oxidoreductase [Nocardioides sp. TRM66260-LWL]
MTTFAPGWDDLPAPLLDFWTERHLCTLTTLRADGRPHVVPVGVALDPEQECAWVITNPGSVKARHVLRDAGTAEVAACQVDGARWSTLEGTAELRSDAASVARAVERYASRYRQPRENPERVALRLTVRRFVFGPGLLRVG